MTVKIAQYYFRVSKYSYH